MHTQEHYISMAARFAFEHLPKLEWSEKAMCDWLAWYGRDGRLGLVFSDSEILAMGAIRVLNKAEDSADFYAHDEKGEIIWISLLIDPTGKYRSALFEMLMERVGPRQHFGYRRDFIGEHDFRIVDFAKVEQFTKKAEV